MIAVLTLTRERLAYTRHCFQTLRDNAGVPFDHFVLDQGSQDGTPDWLANQYRHAQIQDYILEPQNIGCCPGWNKLIEHIGGASLPYEVVVCFDNDCEVVTPDSLRVVCELAKDYDMILSPRVDGLKNPPPAIAQWKLDRYDIEVTSILGNIFMAIPAFIVTRMGWRWGEDWATWAGGESITAWYRSTGGYCGYVPAFRVNHYKTTAGQEADPEQAPYYERKFAEMGLA